MGPTTRSELRDACAAEARRIAPNQCRIDGESGESCAWYHGFWPTLRALDLVTTPDTHARFYAETFGALIRQGARRVLISGSADINMLERVCASFDTADIEPAITFLDRCPSPVALARWYAARTGREIMTHAGDILTFEDDPYDIVCTHSFMGFFTEDERQDLARKWARLLRSGGKVVTINRVRPNASTRVGFTSDQARSFVERTRAAAAARGLDAAAIADSAAQYAARFRIRPVRSQIVLRAFFEDHGFTIDHMRGDLTSEALHAAETGPTTPGGAD